MLIIDFYSVYKLLFSVYLTENLFEFKHKFPKNTNTYK